MLVSGDSTLFVIVIVKFMLRLFYRVVWLFALFAVSNRLQAIDLGLIYDRFPLTLQKGERTEILGPLISVEKTESDAGWTFSPLMNFRRNPGVENTTFDLLYPIVTLDRYGTEYRFQILQIFSFSGGNNQKQQTKRRFTLFPFYFQQRGPNPEDNYTAVLPFYGEVRNRLLRDRVSWVMMPLYVSTDKRDVRTDNYLLPFFHIRRGNGLKGWQFWPVVGKEHKDITTRTNGFKEIEMIPGHDKFFAVWPVFFRNNNGIGSTNEESQRIFLPFYAGLKSPARDTIAYGFPIGFTRIHNREQKYREWGAPWPLVSFARGEGKTANRVWPLFGFARNATLESDFVAWPIYKYNRAKTELLDRERTRILFFLYSDLTEKNRSTGKALRRTDLWPLFQAVREANGNERLQIFAPVEVAFANNDAIRRIYSPIWSIWRSEKNAKTGAYSESFLWNLYRREEAPERKKISFLFGLFQYQKVENEKHFRLFYIPF